MGTKPTKNRKKKKQGKIKFNLSYETNNPESNFLKDNS